MTKNKGSNGLLIVGAFTILILALLLFGGDKTEGNSSEKQTTLREIEQLSSEGNALETTDNNNQDVKVELYHFHLTQQCYSCKTVGALAEKTAKTYFNEELTSGTLKFACINIDLLENNGLAKKYGATGSSLMIGTYINGEFHYEQNTNVWYKINNEEDYLTYLKGVLELRLSGDLS
ncbi:nitrophenyl compound nitroreductase subunit ArsF family protein [Candidatus Altiarchaeota archaeon]